MADREAYRPPARHLGGPNNTNTTRQANANGNNHQQQQPGGAAQRSNGGRKEYDTPDQKVYYVCEACSLTCGFKANDVLRCLSCGGMVMHKPRVNGFLQYQAV